MLVNVAEVLLLKNRIVKPREVSRRGQAKYRRIVQITLVQKIWWDTTKMCNCVECSCPMGVRDLERLWPV